MLTSIIQSESHNKKAFKIDQSRLSYPIQRRDENFVMLLCRKKIERLGEPFSIEVL